MKIYYILLTLFLLESCGGVKDGCYYPDPPPTYNKDGQIIKQ